MSKKKTTNTTKISIPTSISDDHEWEDYLSTISFQMHPANNATKLRLAIELCTWVRENERAYTISQFYTMKGISETTFKKWIDDCPQLRESYTTALSILGDRREVGALENRLNGTIARFVLPYYSGVWKEQELWRASIRKDENDRPGIVTVVLDAIESSPLVPELPKDNNGMD
jgi:hypothetical protein